MTLAKNLKRDLNDPALAGQGTVTTASGPWKASASTGHRDKVGAEIDEITVERQDPGPGSVDAWAKKFSERSRSLTDPLKVLEVDKGRDEAVIRSSPPTKEEGHVDYYEVKMQGTRKASVKRYRNDGSKREDIPFTLTHDGIGRLVDDLTNSQG